MKEIYLSIFILGFKIGEGQWPAAMKADAHKGVVIVTLLEAIFALSVLSFVEVVEGRSFDFPKWVIAFAFVALYFANHFYLVTKHQGATFERQFGTFPKSKRIRIYATATCIFVGVWVAFFVTADAYRQMIGSVVESR